MEALNEKTIITYGTFDLFHIGHLNIIQRLRQMASKLIVGVSTDEFNALKGKKTIIPFEQRAEIVKNIKGVDLVIPENSWEQKIPDIRQYSVDIFAIGKDWEGKFDHLNAYCQVLYLERTKGISSSQLKKTLDSFSVSKDDIIRAFEILEQLKKDFE